VYLNYGVHHLVNVVTEALGSPAAVLIRALDPLDGIDIMRRRRARGRPGAVAGQLQPHGLCRGPGNLTRAMGITLAENRLDLLSDRLRIEDRGMRLGPIVWSPRIGIRVGTDRAWRAHIAHHPAVSGLRTSVA
jgi:DNA-3-methyladenine glycosylase